MVVHRGADTTPVYPLPGLARRTLVYGPGLMMVEFTLEKGLELPEHSHPHEQAGYVVSGRIRLKLNGQIHELGPGDTYFTAPNVLHSVIVLESAVVVDAFSPARQDYMP